MQFDWNSIDTVLLDMDGTLLDLYFDSHFWLEHMPRRWAEKNQLALPEAQERLRPLFEDHAGTLNWYCVDFWSNALQMDVMQLKAEVTHNIAYRPNAQTFLDTCRHRSDDVRLVTNAHRKVLELKISHTGIDQYFRSMLCSHELDLPKEDPDFWQALNDLDPFNAERTLFIDDNDAVLDSAAQYGIRHLYSIAAPDSKNPRREPSRYPMLETLA